MDKVRRDSNLVHNVVRANIAEGVIAFRKAIVIDIVPEMERVVAISFSIDHPDYVYVIIYSSPVRVR